MAKGKVKKDAQNSSAQSPQTPNWPALQPLAPPEDLSLETIVEDQIVVIPNLWTAALCKRYVAFLSALPLTTTPGVPKKGEATRVNDRFQIQDPAFAKLLWEQTALKSLITGEAEGDLASESAQDWGGEVLGLNPNIRIYRYKPGHFFDQHYDESNNIEFPSTPPTPAKTTWTLLLYLTSSSTGCIGGETIFYPEPEPGRKLKPDPEPISVSPETGLALLHRHGNECMLHEGGKVTQGEKWVIRSDLCVRRSPKGILPHYMR